MIAGATGVERKESASAASGEIQDFNTFKKNKVLGVGQADLSDSFRMGSKIFFVPAIVI